MAHYGRLKEYRFSDAATADDIRGSKVYGSGGEKIGGGMDPLTMRIRMHMFDQRMSGGPVFRLGKRVHTFPKDVFRNELRLREARLLADVELREDKLDQRERNISEREELIEFRERDLTAYVGELQGRLSDVA